MNLFEKEKSEIERRLKAEGVPEEQCEIISDAMASADLYDVPSHGIRILDAHIQRIRRDGYNLNPSFPVIRETAAFAVIDGENAFGFVSASRCMKYAVERCKDSGIFHVFSRNNNTFGAAFYYPLIAAKNGMIGIISCNSPAQMAPFGGKEKMLGTNPFAAAIPVPGGDPVIIDMATSIVAKSKFKQYKEAGTPLPDGWALSEDGVPTNDPDEGIRGLICPMAGYKGYSLSLLIDVLSGVLSGAAYLNKVGRFYSDNGDCMNVGFCCAAIDPYAVFGEKYDETINDFVSMLKNSKACPGQIISVPGDRNISHMKAVTENIK